ncbi:uncharacterized protein TrAtP1_010037 [Trichoderma atroviride]|uniref:uncharacterized protein n=1 Tax=Hypocrea atroviridis TaxID=63577 RepID=UPI00331E9EAA|nr:hypothetical protein TrAtP1_010037 [Trichoderma atroviride]
MHPYDDVVIDSTECLFNTRDVLIYFSGLIVENGGTVRLAHFSIKEFLVSSDLASSRIRQHLASTFSFSDIDAHLFIAYSCLSYLNYTSPLAIEGDEKSQSLKVYAASKCLIHLEMVPSEYWYADVIAKLVQALAIRSQTLLNIISEHFSEHFSVLSTVDNFRSARLLDLQLRPYCLTAYHGFVRLTGWLSSQAFSASKYLTQGDLNAALWYAVYGGSKEVAVLLLDRGADPNTSKTTTSDIGYEFKKYGDVLQIAASIGNVAMVNLLLDRDADINAQRWGSALQAAAKYGHLDILKLLVERGANIDGPSNEKGCVLSAAIEHDECFQFLLDSGADINRRGTAEGDRTALCEAARYRCWRQFDLLLERGADVNIGGEGGYPLEKLIYLESMPYDTGTSLWHVYQPRSPSDALPRIQRLLGLSADPNAQAAAHHTALHAAVAGWSDKDSSFCLRVAQLLIDNGADVNIRACTCFANGWATEPQSLLYHCAHRGCTPMAKLLLHNGADVNVNLQARQFANALQVASSEGQVEMMQLLLEYGAEVNARGGYYGTALNAACNIVDNTIHAVQLLLDHGADVNAGGGEFGFALQTVCARSFPEMDTTTRTLAQILLDHGADVNARGSKYGTALQAACAYNPEIVHLLLEHGADINAEGGEYGTALQAALSSFDRDLDQLLLDRGADINAVGGKFGTTLQAACARNSGIVQLLLDRGADINAEGGEYGTALQAASHNDNWDLVELLLDRGANVNANGGKFGTALQAVSWDFDLDLVQLLLDRGADVNINGGRNGSCLQIACANMGSLASEDSMEMIRTLLQRGADPLMHGGDYPSPLHSAVVSIDLHTYTYDTLLQLLLEHGAELNLVDDKRGTALHYVLSLAQDSSLPHRWKDGFETWWIGRICFLLEHGADANLKVGELGSPLHVACAIQYDCETLPTYLKERDQKLKDRIDKQGIIMNLMTKGAETLLNKCHDIDVNAHGGIFGTALQAAAYSGQAKTVQLLLRRRDHIICNEPCGKYRSALNAAVIRAHWDIVDILLEAGAKPDCHVLQEPDEEFLARIREEHGWAAEERYKKFWEVEKGNLRLS